MRSSLAIAHVLSAQPDGQEALRVNKLQRYNIIDTPEEQVFNRVTAMAAKLFETSSAFISFIDSKYVFYKSSTIPLTATKVLCNDCLCTLILEQKDSLLVINDIWENSKIAAMNYLMPVKDVRFYASAALISPEGYKVGALSVTDTLPRVPIQKQIDMLQTLASIITDELELRLVARQSVRVQTDLINIVLHELKNPLMNISLAAEMLEDEPAAGNLRQLSALILRNAKRLGEKLNDLLHLSLMENIEFKLNKEPIDITALLVSVRANFIYQAEQKQQQILFESPGPLTIYADRERLQEMLDNLLNNAVKFSFAGTSIHILLQQTDKDVIIEFRDQGQGLTEDDKTKLFIKFARLSATPTGKERSNGLGLSIVKTLAELHQGKVWAESGGKNKGTSFFLSLPKGNDPYSY